MLKNKIQSGFIVGTIIFLQLWFLFSQQLFGDEAFYWLEGQYLDLSYSELPGWTAWMIRLGTELFGNNYFAVRIVSYLGYLSIFWAVFLINKSLSSSNFNSILYLLAIPLFVLLAVMALPDIWLVFFVIWIIFVFVKANQSKKTMDWAVLGIVIAAAINVHVRMWIWLFIAGLSFLWILRKQLYFYKKLFLVTLPIAILGFLPILWFNLNNDFALFAFQFSNRHPWVFQWQNIGFVLSQFVVVTPLVFIHWIKGFFYLKKKPVMIQWILITAIMHWLLYVLLSFFADGLRTTVHWLLISYVPVLGIVGIGLQARVFAKWAIVSGLLISLWLLFTLNFNHAQGSNIQARILDNSTGWYELSVAVKRVQKQRNLDNIVADYFMTAAELAFELEKPTSIKVLPHAKSIKHGRQKQLQIMGMLLDVPKHYKQPALLVVEDSTLKLKNKAKYYAQLCKNFTSLELLESIAIGESNKLFHLFEINNASTEQACEIPALFYVESTFNDDSIHVKGWAILHQIGIEKLYFKSGERETLIANNRLENTGVAQQFPEIRDFNNPNIGFEVNIFNTRINNNSFQIKAIGNNGRVYLSQTYYLD